MCLKCVLGILSVVNLHPNTCDFQIATAHISRGHNPHNETIAAPAQSAKRWTRADWNAPTACEHADNFRQDLQDGQDLNVGL